MTRIITYAIMGALTFGMGSCYQKEKTQKEVLNKKYETFQEKNNWYLSTPIGNKIINENHELGSVQQRMNGLLKEKYSDLKESLEKILDEN